MLSLWFWLQELSASAHQVPFNFDSHPLFLLGTCPVLSYDFWLNSSCLSSEDPLNLNWPIIISHPVTVSWRFEGSSEHWTGQFSQIISQLFLYQRFLKLMEFLLWITLLSHRQSKHVGLAEKKIAMHEKWRNIFIIVCFDGRRQNHGSQCGPAKLAASSGCRMVAISVLHPLVKGSLSQTKGYNLWL